MFLLSVRSRRSGHDMSVDISTGRTGRQGEGWMDHVVLIHTPGTTILMTTS